MPDAIDRVIHQWAKVRPDLDVSPVGVIARLARLQAIVDEEMEAFFAEQPVTKPTFSMLAALVRVDELGGVSQRRVANEMRLTPGTVSARIDRMVSDGLVARAPDPSDKRGSLVSLTERGWELFEAPSLVKQLEPVAAALDRIADMLAAHFSEWGATSRFRGQPNPDGRDQADAAGIKEQADRLATKTNAASRSDPLSSLVVRTHALVLSALESDPSRAVSLVNGVLRPLVRASEPAGAGQVGELPAEQPPAKGFDARLWQLALATATLAGAAGGGDAAGWLKLAAARLGQLTHSLPAAADVPARDTRQAVRLGTQPAPGQMHRVVADTAPPSTRIGRSGHLAGAAGRPCSPFERIPDRA